MTIGLNKQSESVLRPSRRIDGLGAIKILQSFLIFPYSAVNVSASPESDGRRIKLNCRIEVANGGLRLAKLHPSHMTIEVGMGIGRILSDPPGHDLQITFRIRTKQLVEHLNFFRGRRFFHCSYPFIAK